MITGHQISKELCDALGLPKYTRGSTLRCYTGELVTVECEYYPDGSFQPALAQYCVMPRVDAPVDFDDWMRERTDRAHCEYLQRTSRLPC